jgi:hypothetical protein
VGPSDDLFHEVVGWWRSQQLGHKVASGFLGEGSKVDNARVTPSFLATEPRPQAR